MARSANWPRATASHCAMRPTCWRSVVSPMPCRRAASFLSPPAMEAPTYLWSLLCDYFLIDQAGKYSFIGVFDRIGAVTFPVVQRSFYVAVSLEGDPTTSAPALLDVWSPEGTLLIPTPDR